MQAQQSSESQRLLKLRQSLGISQRELAREFKVSPAAVALWETGARRIPGSVKRLIEIYEQHLGTHDSSPLSSWMP